MKIWVKKPDFLVWLHFSRLNGVRVMTVGEGDAAEEGVFIPFAHNGMRMGKDGSPYYLLSAFPTANTRRCGGFQPYTHALYPYHGGGIVGGYPRRVNDARSRSLLLGGVRAFGMEYFIKHKVDDGGGR